MPQIEGWEKTVEGSGPVLHEWNHKKRRELYVSVESHEDQHVYDEELDFHVGGYTIVLEYSAEGYASEPIGGASTEEEAREKALEFLRDHPSGLFGDQNPEDVPQYGV